MGAFRTAECEEDSSGTVFVGQATGEGSLMRQILTACHPDRPLPRNLDHQELAQSKVAPGPPPRCVIFLNPVATEAIELQDELMRRYPEGRLESLTNPSGTTVVDVISRQ